MSDAPPYLADRMARAGTPGDGNFRWYHARGLAEDDFCSEWPDRETAIKQGTWFHAGAPFVVFEAERAALDLRVFRHRGAKVVDMVGWNNTHLFHPEHEFEPIVSPEALDRLGDSLDYWLAQWWARYRPAQGTLFASVRSVEAIAAEAAAA